jgi:hypothetical protein
MYNYPFRCAILVQKTPETNLEPPPLQHLLPPEIPYER